MRAIHHQADAVSPGIDAEIFGEGCCVCQTSQAKGACGRERSGMQLATAVS